MEKFGNKPDAKYFGLLYCKSNDQIIWGANNFQLPPFKGFIVWKRKTIGETFTMSMCAIASLSERLGTTSKWVEIALQDRERFHPTQKPIKLYEWIFKNYAKPNDKILDTHLGSGSSRIAADKANLPFVGCELDPDYFYASVKRFNEYSAQQTMF